MRILLVTPSYFPIVGGSEILTRVLSSKLNEIGISADIMTYNMDTKWNPAWKEEVVKEGSATVFREAAFNPFHRLPNPLFNLFRINIIPKPSYMKRFKNYDIVHFISEADIGFPLFSYFIKKPKLFQCLAIFRKGGLYKYYTSERAFLGKTFKKIFPLIADKFVISSTEGKELLTDLGVPESKIALLDVGVDTEIFQPDSTKKAENMLLFVGRIYRIKGLHVLLQALPYIKTPVKLNIIGPPWDPEYVKEIEEVAQKINATGFHKVSLLGEMTQSELVSWYQRASVLVCPYVYETCSNVIRESLACGTPVVSTGSHLIEGGSDGILLARLDPKDLAKAISKLLSENEVRKRFGEEGRGVIEQYFSWESVIKDLVKLYNNLIELYAHS